MSSQKWKGNNLNDILKSVHLRSVWQQAHFKHSEEEIVLLNLPLSLNPDGIEGEISIDIIEDRQNNVETVP